MLCRFVPNSVGVAIVVTLCYLLSRVQEAGLNLPAGSKAKPPKKLALGIPSASGGDDYGDRLVDRDSGASDDGAVEKREWIQEQLVALKPGHHIGPYRLQEHIGYLGSRPIHEYDPAFHPHEAKRVGFQPRGMISAPPRPSVCLESTGPELAVPWPPRRKGGRDKEEGIDGLILKGGAEADMSEGSYRLKRRFEGGSHGEVWRGVRLGADGKPSTAEGYVLKRMLLEKGQHVLQAGIREIYFGELLQSQRGSPRIARYVEHLYLFGDHDKGRFGRAGEEGAGGGGGDWGGGEAVPTEMWLVFRDEGMSLRHYLYTEREAKGFVLHGQSNFWRDMRLDPKGPEVMKSLLRQTLEGTHFLHEAGILHRDLKPSNLIVSAPSPPPSPPPEPARRSAPASGGGGSTRTPGETTGAWGQSSPGFRYEWGIDSSASAAAASTIGRSGSDDGDEGARKRRRRSSENRGGVGKGGSGGVNGGDPPRDSSPSFSSSSTSRSSPPPPRSCTPLSLRVADFSSAVDEGAMAAGLYGAAGPAQGEETLGYAPPEVLFDPETAYSSQRPESYDVWSIGVILLELILGTPEVFTVDQRTSAILDRDLAFEDDAVRAKAHLLAAMADMCIYSGSGAHGGESSSSPLGDRAVVDERCTLAELGKAVHTRDALDIGFPDQWGLDLLWRLLRWHPTERISVSDALEHAYFVGPYRSRRDGSLHATQREAMTHDGWFTGSERASPTAVARRPPPSPYASLWGAAARPGGEGFRTEEGSVSLGRHGGAAGKLVPSPRPAGEAKQHSFTLDHQHTLDLQHTCPKCNRSFELWKSCHNHVVGRGHASFCQYDTASLPPCVSSHSMLPFDPHSGWCDVQGRRSRIEDYHSIVFQEDYKFYGVFDGHCGTRAAKFASRALHLNLELFLNAVQDAPTPPPGYSHAPRQPGHDRNASIERAVRAAFRKTQKDFLDAIQPADGGGSGKEGGPMSHATEPQGPSASPPTGGDDAGVGLLEPDADGGHTAAAAATAMGEGFAAEAATVASSSSEDESGTTATVALVYSDVTIVAHVGDSRAVLCCDDAGRAVEITEDHTPYSAVERARVEAAGGSVEHRGVLRVNGELAVTRTLGNVRLSRHGVLSSEPDVIFVSHGRVDGDADDGSGIDSGGSGDGSGNGSGSGTKAAFLVLASDGLWDVVSSQEAVDMVKEVIHGAFPHAHQGETDAVVVAAAGAAARPAGGGGPAETGGQGKPGARGRGGVPRGYGSYAPGQTFQVAATALTHEAYVRGSTDNIGVCVVDLRHH